MMYQGTGKLFACYPVPIGREKYGREIRGDQKPKRSENIAWTETELISDQQQNRLTARSTGVHKARAGRPPGRPVCTNMHRIVHRIARSITRSTDAGERLTARSTDWHDETLCWTRSTARSTGCLGRSTAWSIDKHIWARICLSFLDSDFISKLETNPIGVS